MKRELLLIIVMFSIMILFNACIFKPNNSNEFYYLYVGNWDNDEVFIIDTEDNSVIDTLDGFGHVWDLAITPGGSKLYVSTREGMYNQPGALFSVDLQSKTKRIILNSAADVFISPSGTPLVIAHIPNDTMAQVGFIDTLTDQISFIDSLNILDQSINYQNLVFDPIEPIFYAWTNQHYLFGYNYNCEGIVHLFNSESVSEEMIISKDGKYIFFPDKTLDIVKDSIIATWEGRKGTMMQSNDGKTLYLTDYGNPFSTLLAPPSGLVRVLDLETYTIVNSMSFNEAAEHYYPHLDRMIITPNGKKAFVSSPAEIFSVDLNRNIAVSIFRPVVGNSWFKPIVVGKKP